MTYTENGGTAYRSSESFCLDMFFKAGAMRNSTAAEIADVVIRAYAEDPDKTMKIVFFARDARGGLGERRFFRIAIAALVRTAPDAVKKNISLFAEYGRFDDLCVLLDTPLENAAVEVIKAQLDKDIAAMNAKKPASLLAKWMPPRSAATPTYWRTVSASVTTRSDTKLSPRALCSSTEARSYATTVNATPIT